MKSNNFLIILALCMGFLPTQLWTAQSSPWWSIPSPRWSNFTDSLQSMYNSFSMKKITEQIQSWPEKKILYAFLATATLLMSYYNKDTLIKIINRLTFSLESWAMDAYIAIVQPHETAIIEKINKARSRPNFPLYSSPNPPDIINIMHHGLMTTALIPLAAEQYYEGISYEQYEKDAKQLLIALLRNNQSFYMPNEDFNEICEIYIQAISNGS